MTRMALLGMVLLVACGESSGDGTGEGVDASQGDAGEACDAESWLRALEFVTSEQLIRTGGMIRQCDFDEPQAAASCIEAALAAGDGFSASWTNAAGELHAYVGRPGEGGGTIANHYRYLPVGPMGHEVAETGPCSSLTSQQPCPDPLAGWCWSCSVASYSLMCSGAP